MKIKCPVAGCDYTVRGADDGFKHWQKYDEFHKKLHWNWLNYFYSDLANSDWSDEVKFRFAYKKWHEDQKKIKVQAYTVFLSGYWQTVQEYMIPHCR